jgi:hypothetical protein
MKCKQSLDDLRQRCEDNITANIHVLGTKIKLNGNDSELYPTAKFDIRRTEPSGSATEVLC